MNVSGSEMNASISLSNIQIELSLRICYVEIYYWKTFMNIYNCLYTLTKIIRLIQA